jgi:hypothetical protein
MLCDRGIVRTVLMRMRTMILWIVHFRGSLSCVMGVLAGDGILIVIIRVFWRIVQIVGFVFSVRIARIVSGVMGYITKNFIF